MSSKNTPNILVFGETGAGKSSVVNMLEGGEDAPVSNAAFGATFRSTRHEKTISGSTFTIFDTVGLNEAPKGTVSPRQAIDNLYQLIRNVEGGLGLLVYVMRGPRIKSIAQQNYKLFYEGFCRKKVPIVMIVTGLEATEDMDGWWDENRGQFEAYDMHFNAIACITATKGKLKDGEYTYQREYEQSKRKVENLIHDCYSRTPWRMSIGAWFFAVAFKMREVCTSTLGFERDTLAQELEHALQSRVGWSTKTIDARGPPPNVIVFGETGVGKSSILNMLEGDRKAPVADHAAGVTSKNTCYERNIHGKTFKIHDTVGLDEGSAGTVPAKTAIESLYRLIRDLDDGINLLVYVVRASPIQCTTKKNYHMYYDIFCRGKVPIVVIITGLENREPMDGWWEENEATFHKCQMAFDGHACITSTEGKRGEVTISTKYEASKVEVESLILRSFSADPWKLPTTSWFTSVAMGLYNVFARLFGFNHKLFARELCRAMQECGGLSSSQAMMEAQEIERKLRESRA